MADFGLAHAAESGATMFEPVFTEVRGTPGNTKPTMPKLKRSKEFHPCFKIHPCLCEISPREI